MSEVDFIYSVELCILDGDDLTHHLIGTFTSWKQALNALPEEVYRDWEQHRFKSTGKLGGEAMTVFTRFSGSRRDTIIVTEWRPNRCKNKLNDLISLK